MHSIYFFSIVVVVGFDISMWKFASATLFSMLFQWLNELLSFTRFLIPSYDENDLAFAVWTVKKNLKNSNYI